MQANPVLGSCQSTPTLSVAHWQEPKMINDPNKTQTTGNGRKWSPEAKQKLAATLRARHAAKRANGGSNESVKAILPAEAGSALATELAQPVSSAAQAPSTPKRAAEGPEDDPKVAAKKHQIRLLWKANQIIQARNKKNRFELGKAFDELHGLRARRGNGTYDKDVEDLGISKSTAWRVRSYYRELAGLAPVSQFVSIETNSTAGSDSAETPAAAGIATVSEMTEPVTTATQQSGADRLRAGAKLKKQVTQVRLEPARHDVFRKALKECAAEFGTRTDSDTIFMLVTTFRVQPCGN
jgi:hypothetical protein